jgi:hypothetical protein
MPPHIIDEISTFKIGEEQEREVYQVPAIQQVGGGVYVLTVINVSRQTFIEILRQQAMNLLPRYSRERLEQVLSDLDNTHKFAEYCLDASLNWNRMGTGAIFRSYHHSEQWKVKRLESKILRITREEFEEVKDRHFPSTDSPQPGTVFSVTDETMWMYDLPKRDDLDEFFKDHWHSCLIEFVVSCDEVDGLMTILLERVLLTEDESGFLVGLNCGTFSTQEVRQQGKMLHPVPIGRKCSSCEKKFKYTDAGSQSTFICSKLPGGCELQATHAQCMKNGCMLIQ